MKNPALILLQFLNVWWGCNSISDTTPLKFENKTVVKEYIYETQKEALIDSMRFYIRNKIDPFYQKENDTLTEILIDTILYSPKMDKIAFFVITKNSDDKLLTGGTKDEFHYNGHCFTAYLASDRTIEDISWLSAYNISNYKNLKSASERMREMHFDSFKGEGSSNLKYNLNDIRFWNSSVWRNGL